MARYAEGDDAAFAAVFAALSPRLSRFLRRLTGSDEMARDLAQEAWVRVHQGRGAFKPGMPVLPWVYTIARNVFLDSARAVKRRPIAKVALENVAEPVAHGADAEQAVALRQAASAVDRALAAMTAARREAFILIRFEGFSVAEAAAMLGVSENAVKLRAFQAYELIRQELASG
jgi:RNA polymerase sigma-70 factor (ECF subfamily)